MAGSFEDLLTELFAPLDDVVLRKMFGGVGVFKAGIMFGLLSEGALYLRVDEISQPAFEAERAPQFVYMGMKGRSVAMPYFRLPERLYDEPEEFVRWSAIAYTAASAAAAAKAKTKPAVAKKPPGKTAPKSKTKKPAGKTRR
jgi:DNA transformation protein